MATRPQHPSSLGRRTLLLGIGLAGIGLSLPSCRRGQSGAADPEPAGNSVNLYIWDTYIGERTIADFQAQSGLRVQTRYFATNDELFSRLKSGDHGFDVIVPSNEFVTLMRNEDLLMPLEMSRIPNFANIAPEFRDPDYDQPAPPQHSVPYAWLVIGIGYRKSRVNGIPDSWKWMYDSDLYKNRIALTAESGDLIRLGARYLGKPINGLTPADIKLVENMLIRQKPNIKSFHEDNGQKLLRAGDVDLVMETNGDIAQVAAEDPDIGFVVPQEGSLLNTDTLCIPRGAPNPDNAHRLINFLLDAEAGRHIAETILYPTPNMAARALMPESYSANPIIFPTGPGMEASSWGRYEGAEQARLFEEALDRVMAA